jgi:lycopene beta-cyclase
LGRAPLTDLLLLGAGLASALIAQRLSQGANPPKISIIEAQAKPFGEHTWSFHERDLDPSDRAWVLPLAAHRWPRQAVRFPAFTRVLESPYASLTSRSVDAALKALGNVEILTDRTVGAVTPLGATLEGGEALSARCVVDARGFASDPSLELGFQKFVGLEVETSEPHGVSEPVIMDARVTQEDGYRFVYLLPFSPTRLLIEDTRYADGAALDQGQLRADILDYAASQGWSIGNCIVREEHGVLPIALAFDAERFWAGRPKDVPQAGMRAALFHPTTGYSLPEAVRLANVIAEHWQAGSAVLAEKIRAHATKRAREQGFYRLLNRMLFRAAAPDKRHLVLQRFYRLPTPLIERFYAGRTNWADIARILVGRPPVPVGRALGCLSEASVFQGSSAHAD